MSFFSGVISFVSEHWLSALVFILVFSVLIILHELGHFWAARKSGVGVLEFGFGLPPKVWGKKTSRKNSEGKNEEMEWTLNAIPFGGFVRLEGEEEKSDSPSSFSNRPLGWRILVVCGGVIMNFLLGWILLTIGYGVGMNPLSPSDAQKESYVEQGIWEKEEDKIVITSLSSSPEAENFKMMDIIQGVDGNRVSTPEEFHIFYSLAQSQKHETVSVTVKRFNTDSQSFDEISEVLSLESDSPFSSETGEVLITDIYPKSPAEAIGLKAGDIIVGVEQGEIQEANQFIKTLQRYFEKGTKNVRISILRENEENNEENNEGEKIKKVFIVPFNVDGQMGIGVRNSFADADTNKMILESRTLYIPLKKVSYPWTEAPVEAFHESVRWMGLSLSMVKNVFNTIISDQKIPEGIGGPVAIADTTDKLVDHGDWTKILQFTAILSLSLAVVNIMPFPGLDGGRLIFLLAEGGMMIISSFMILIRVRKKALPSQLPEKYEMPLHAVGYFLLLGLILWITWNDVTRLFF